jgi:hypothetical protein
MPIIRYRMLMDRANKRLGLVGFIAMLVTLVAVCGPITTSSCSANGRGCLGDCGRSNAGEAASSHLRCLRLRQ